jgi:hypothetical protein
MKQKWIVRVSEVMDIWKWYTDEEMEFDHIHSKDHRFNVMAESPQEALEEIKTKFTGKDWHMITTDEKIAERQFKCHSLFNTDALFEKAEGMKK